MRYKSFEEMPVWQKAHKLVIKLWKRTEIFPKEDTYTLARQLRNSVLSISANIAEGFGRHHSLDKARFYINSRGSLYETANHLHVARDLSRMNLSEYQEMIDCLRDVGFDLNKLIKSIKLA